MRWEIRAPWPSLSEIEQRFEERLRTRWGGSRADQPAETFIAAREIRIEMDLPGLSEDDVTVRVEGNRVIIEERAARAPDASSSVSAHGRPRALRHDFPLPAECQVVSHEFVLIEGVLMVRIRARRGGPL